MRYTLHRTASLQRLVRKEEFAAAFNDDVEMIPANQLFQMTDISPKRHKIIALRLEPKTLKSRIVDKDVPRAGRIGPIFKVEIASVQCQGFSVDVKRDGRKSPVVALGNQFPIRGLKKRLGNWPRCQKGIERHQGQPGGVVKQNHHQRGCQEGALISPFESRQSAHEQGDRCYRQWKAKVSKGI